MSPVLEALTTDEFTLTFSCTSNPRAIYRALRRSDYVRELRDSVRSGELTETTIRKFCTELLKEFATGKRFQHELAIAAIAVAFERRVTTFADEFSRDLANLEIAEMPIASRVAREVCHERRTLSTNNTKAFTLSRNHDDWRVVEEPKVHVVNLNKCFDYEGCNA